MPRIKKCRRLEGPPLCNAFKPRGIPTRFIKTVSINLDEYEAIRLADHQDLEHEEASKLLGVSRSVFTRLLDGARKKLAQAIIEGTELIIEGGDYHFQKKTYRCLDCYNVFEVNINDPDPANCPKCSSTKIDNLNNYFGGRGQCFRHGGRGNF
jgi:uncharacterized protein